MSNIPEILSVIHVAIIFLVVINVWCVIGYIISGMISSTDLTLTERFICSVVWIWLVAVAIHQLSYEWIRKQ